MIIYETAEGKLWTQKGLFTKTMADREAEWDEDTMGPWSGRRFSWFADWLIEAINTGVVRERELLN